MIGSHWSCRYRVSSLLSDRCDCHVISDVTVTSGGSQRAADSGVAPRESPTARTQVGAAGRGSERPAPRPRVSPRSDGHRRDAHGRRPLVSHAVLIVRGDVSAPPATSSPRPASGCRRSSSSVQDALAVAALGGPELDEVARVTASAPPALRPAVSQTGWVSGTVFDTGW